ncbi:DUF3748 domain-containing protein [Atlantibacter hermannii]|uniref:DUF3748 domain-containing protein n=1 Tax=Atlantibacter hermannii TaxID=565 RepID=UPI0028A2DDB9|nr:DUF3748 domain-containing protein [Atlantibacter hermannii]
MKQLTFAPRHHQLTNINTWTPDSQWLAFDVRPSGASFTGETIERVNVATGEIDVLYRATQGAHVGVVTVNPHKEQYVCIHGPENPDATWQYDFHHRRGVLLENGLAQNLDAMDITPPFTPGALRGGSHVHVFSPDGEWVSFTYNDHVMHENDPKQDLRNVGVALPIGPVTPPCRHPREYAGQYWCALVSRTTPEPTPGSDEINRAYEEGWVGAHGYRKPDGSVQRRALAFIGDTLSAAGEKIPELFIVDLPENAEQWRQAGDEPLEGTAATLPAPPAGVIQRRLTFTHHRSWPGLVNTPRHWVRVNPQGDAIAFLMRDERGVAQVWVISPNGGQPKQVTFSETGVESAFNWHPNGEWLGFIHQGSVAMCHAATGDITPLTRQHSPSGDAVVFSPDGKRVAWMAGKDGYQQLWMTETGH